MDNSTKFAELEREIRRIDVDADTIQVSYHLRNFAALFQRHIVDDETLSDLFGFLNRIALGDGKFAVTMAVIFASRQLDDLVIKETKLRNAMLTILQQNFQNIDALKQENIGKFYNSVTLLGEYYHRKRFANGKRIRILGQSLLLLLTTELEKEIKMCEESETHTIDPEFAKVILSQVTLNGGEAKIEHTQEIDDLNYSIRKCLINVRGLCSRTKAYLLMALDLFYTNFSLGTKLLDKLYGKYLFDPDESVSSNQSSETVKQTEAKKDQTGTEKPTKKPEINGTESNNVPNKPTEKTESGKKIRAKSLPSKPKKKEDKVESPLVPVAPKTQNVAPKKTTHINHRPPLHHTSPRKDQRPKPPAVQKTPPHRRPPQEKLKSTQSDRTPPKTPTSQSRTKTPENPTVLTQNFKGPTRNSTSPANNSSPQSNSVSRKLHVTTTAQEDNVENLAWDDLTLEDESPQKINPHTKSFLNFLTQK
ncbi:uncharacterized protein LOC131433653 [Malaya genurostris]|uniref:uncharacterized protein LOC131433653 n=1 Tax=Malaya genurostris TaxID=325434 RepID=UPI0026F38FEE|nr:uncharacterized protein LOC131433653 [Malaya genurostris]